LETITQGSGDAARITTFSYRDTEDNTNGYLHFFPWTMNQDGGSVTPRTGRRVLAQPLHDGAALANNPCTAVACG